MIRAPRIKERIYSHVTRRLADGRWVCQGGPRSGPRCSFTTSLDADPTQSYADAVTHATEWGATPPDMPSGSWTSA